MKTTRATKKSLAPLAALTILAFAGALVARSATPPDVTSGEPGPIAYLQLSGPFWQVWLVNSDGTNARQLTASPGDKTHLDWRPGTSELLYQTNDGRTFLLDVRTSKTREILESTGAIEPRWTPDGERVVYEVAPEELFRRKGSIWISGPEGKNARKLCEDALLFASPVPWGAGRLLHVKSRMELDRSFRHDFHVLELEAPGVHRAYAGDDEPVKLDPAISSRGELAYVSLRSGFYEIWTAELPRGAARQLTRLRASSGNPDWSPDGSSLVFDADGDGLSRIYRIDSSGKHLRRLTFGEHPSRKPVWSREEVLP